MWRSCTPHHIPVGGEDGGRVSLPRSVGCILVTPVPQTRFHLSQYVSKAALTWSCHYSLVPRSLFSLYFFMHSLSPFLSFVPFRHATAARPCWTQGSAQRRRFIASQGSSFLSVIEVFAATASAAWSHDLRVNKMSERTRKRGQKRKEEEEEGGGGEGIYIIVVEELSIELLATCKVHLEDCQFLCRPLLIYV